MPGTLLFDGREIGPRAFEDAVLRAASGFERLGVAEGDVVGVMLRNEPAFLVAAFAASRLGAYHCPVNWHFKAEEARWIFADSGAKALVVHADLLPQIEGVVPAGVEQIVVAPQAATRRAYGVPPERVRVPAGSREWSAWLAAQPRWAGEPRTPRWNMPYTSGTTGRPKGVRRLPPRREEAARVAELAREARYKGFGIETGMRALLPGPLYHSAPNLYAIQALQLEGLLALEPRFDAERTLALIERHRLTHAYLVPTMYVRLLKLPESVKRRYDLSSLRFVSTTGSPCPPEVKRAMIEWWGPVIHECYASSEAGVVTSITPEEALDRPGSAGRPVGAGALRILDAEGRALPAGEVGLVYARQPAYPDFTYNNNPQARRALERDGLWTLGDMGYVDEAGYLYICDRAADMVISGGVNIYPAEIEAVLHAMPGVRDCAVFGIPDPEFGEVLAAAIEPEPGARLDGAAVKAFLGERIAHYKVPRVVEQHERLPREESGKIFKRRLRDPHWEKSGRKI
ncbi:MAG: AMP-binding protein [Betaproteobacteria bacterium]|nr:AMP-binding protein [Betaproteobacteria bacterium]